MNLFDDIKSPALLYMKGVLFGLLTIMAAALTVMAENRWHEILFLAVCVWASCRFYYFLFYVLDHYIECSVGGDKNASVFSMLLKLCGSNRGISPPDFETAMSGNLFAELPKSLLEEWIENLAVSKNARIERIVSTGQASPEDFWYDQDEAEWVVVLHGEAELEFEDPTERRRLQRGDYVLIPAHRKHRVAWTSPNEPTVWLAVFFKPAD